MLFASKHALSRVNPNEARADERTVNREELILPNPQRKDDPVAPGIQVACERMKRREILGCNMRPLAQAGFAFYGMRRRRLKTRQASQWGVSGDWFYQTRVPLQAAVKPADCHERGQAPLEPGPFRIPKKTRLESGLVRLSIRRRSCCRYLQTINLIFFSSDIGTWAVGLLFEVRSFIGLSSG